MKKLWILWGSFTAFAVIVLVLVLVGVLHKEKPTEEALSFCEKYPDAVFCTNSDATYEDITLDMFTTLESNFPSAFDQDFCSSYFNGKVAEYCKEDPTMILPPDFHLLSHTVTMENIKEGMYDVYTTHQDGSDAYIIRIAVVQEDGVYHISGLSYYDISTPEDLNLSNEDVNDFMGALFEAVNESSPTFCSDYFTGDAYTACTEQEAPLVYPVMSLYNVAITEVNTNEFTYIFTNQDETTTTTYHITFTDEIGTVRIANITVEQS